MNLIATGVIKPPVRDGHCTLRVNGDFYLLRFNQELQPSIEQAAAHDAQITVTGTGHTFKHPDCGKHHFYIVAKSID